MLWFKQRDIKLREIMDDEKCDSLLLFNTYEFFRIVNMLTANWGWIYRKIIRPRLRANGGHGRFLDVGFGGGDVIDRLALMCKKDGFEVEFLGIDLDKRAVEFVNKKSHLSNVHFLAIDARDILKSNEKYDFVISNSVLHHLQDSELIEFCAITKGIARCCVIHNDVARSAFSYYFFRLIFPLLAPFIKKSFAGVDGAYSIRRSFYREELASLVSKDWKVIKVFFPPRLLLTNEFPASTNPNCQGETKTKLK
ncbi:MAG: methyltransferase domain-containing protein [Oligoflexia bacterium]|nr:methyltransferase domain-containing protein [Oligoflexia bacterium]